MRIQRGVLRWARTIPNRSKLHRRSLGRSRPQYLAEVCRFVGASRHLRFAPFPLRYPVAAYPNMTMETDLGIPTESGTPQVPANPTPEPAPKASPGTGQEISPDEIANRLCLFSTELVSEIFKTAQRQVEGEDRREGLLTTKAGSLLGQAGLCLTIASGIGGLLFQTGGLAERLGRGWFVTIVLLYVITLSTGACSILTALRVIKVRADYEGIDENVIFNTTELLAADEAVAAAHSRRPMDVQSEHTVDWGKSLGTAEIAAITRYRRYLIPHLWQIQRKHFAIHEQKAKTLLCGQQLFGKFVLSLGMLGLSVLLALIDPALRGPTIPSQPPPTQMASLPMFSTPPKISQDSGPNTESSVPSSPAKPDPLPNRPTPTSVPPGGKPTHLDRRPIRPPR